MLLRLTWHLHACIGSRQRYQGLIRRFLWGIRTRSDQFVTSGSSLPVVHGRPKSKKVVRPRGSQRGSRWHMTPDTVAPWSSSPISAFDRRGDRALPCPDPAACQPENRKVDSSILSLTTSFGLLSSALTRANAY